MVAVASIPMLCPQGLPALNRRRWLIEAEDGRFARRDSVSAVVRWVRNEWGSRPSRMRITFDGTEVGHVTYGGFPHVHGSDALRAAFEAEN